MDFVEAVSAGESFVVFDTETTSKDARTGELVEIGAVRLSGGKVTDTFETLVKPTRGIVGKQIHGITNADVANAPQARRKRRRKLLDFAGDDILVGHNVGFDISFVEAALADGTRIEPGTYLDTLVLARGGYPDLDAHKLADLVEFFELSVDPKHRALADAEATAALLQPHGRGPARSRGCLQGGRGRVGAHAQGWR